MKGIRTAVLADLKPVRPLAGTGTLFFAFMAIFLLAAAVGVAVLGFGGWLAENPAQRIAVFTALGVGSGLLAFSLGRLMVPGSRMLLRPALLVVAVLALMVVIFGLLFRPREESTFVATGLFCLKIGLTCAIPTALLFWVVLRRGMILNPVVTAVAAGTLAGLSGLTLLEIFCPNLNQYHILVWHFGAVLASVAGGIAVGGLAEYFARTRSRG